MPQYNFLIFPALFLFGQERAAKLRPYAEHAEEVCRDLKSLDFLWFAIAGQIEFVPGVRAKLIEGMRLLLPVKIRGRCDGIHVDVLLRARVDQRDDAVGILKRHGVEQERFCDAEHRGVGAEAERQGHDGHQRGEAMLCQHAYTEANVLKEGKHRSSYS